MSEFDLPDLERITAATQQAAMRQARRREKVSTYTSRLYRSPIRIRPGKSGSFTVERAVVEGSTPIVGFRQAILRGLPPVTAKLAGPLTYHRLVEDGAVWMTDLPEELNQIGELVETLRPRGRVLVGGLGLGVLAKAVANRSTVEQVTVIELSEDVINLCTPKHAPYTVVQADIATYLAEHEEPFDFYLLDTWAGTGELTWWSEVMPLRRIIRQRFGARPVVHCWAEDIMLGQVEKSILLGNRIWKYKGFPEEVDDALLDRFVNDVGLPEWEREFAAVVGVAKSKGK